MKIVNSNGANIPALGFGTYKLTGDTCTQMVKNALDIGYCHIDTAQVYDNESAIGTALKESGVKRDDIFLTTKVWVTRFRNGDLQKSVEASLKKLQTSHVDLLLLHWPNPEIPLEITIPALNKVHKNGMARHIGVSNFNSKRLKKAVELSDAPIATNQVEYHVLLDQNFLKQECKKYGASLTAYSPLGKGKILGNPVLQEIAQNKSKTSAQIALRWLYQSDNVIAIPKTSSLERAKENFNILDFELSEQEMKDIAKLQSPEGRIVHNDKLDPDWD